MLVASQVVPPYAEPIDLLEVKAQLRIDFTAEDTLIPVYIRTARDWVEQFTGRALCVQQWQWFLDGFFNDWYRPDRWRDWRFVEPWQVERQQIWQHANWGVLRPPRPPLMAIDSLGYTDPNGNPQVLTPSQYQMDQVSLPARLLPAFGTAWPSTQAILNAVKILFRAGHIVPITGTSTPNLNAPNHPYIANQPVRLSNSGGRPPAPLAVATDYFVVNPAPGTVQISATSGGAAIALTDSGVGTTYLGVLPDMFRSALLLIIGALYEERSDSIDHVENTEAFRAAKMLLWPHRVVTL